MTGPRSSDAAPGASGAAVETVPPALAQRDPDYIRRSLGFWWPLIAAWFRPDIRGLDRIPAAGPILASMENARAALDRGAAVLVHPGGDREAHRPSWHGHRVEFAHREGFVRLAPAGDVPIVPVVSIGGQETALFLTRGERLARALGIDRRFRLKVLPVSIALPWGLDVGDLMQRTLDELAAQRRFPVIG